MDMKELAVDKLAQQQATLAIHDLYVKGFRSGALAMKQKCGDLVLALIEPVDKELAALVGRALLDAKTKDPEPMLFERNGL